MFQVIVYRGKKSRVASRGTYLQCLNWMGCQKINCRSQLTGWELKYAPIARVVDVSLMAPMGTVKRNEYNTSA